MEDFNAEARDRLQRNAFMHHNFIELESVEQDKAVFKMVIHPEVRNPSGMVHGGAIFALADNATGAAAHTDGRIYVTQTSTFHFLRNQGEGTVRASAYVRHRGKATCLVSVDVTGENGKLLATGEFTFFCVDPAVLDAKNRK
ncbi:MAG: PaaI family thioesterase [Oscillibacter sp.]